MAETTRLVRLKPYNKRKGHTLLRYSYRGISFRQNRGWTRVQKDVADYLETVHQVPGDVDAPLAFDVCSESEAKTIDKTEAEAGKPPVPADHADSVTEARPKSTSNPPQAAKSSGGDLKTADLPKKKTSSHATR